MHGEEGTAREPGWLRRAVFRAYDSVFRLVAELGLPPSFFVLLEVKTRRTGRKQSSVLILAEHGGERYAVSVVGERSDWVRNLRAANGDAFLRHGRRRRAKFVEVPVGDRAPILKAYLKRALGARDIFEVSHKAPREHFQRIAHKHPVFKVVKGDN